MIEVAVSDTGSGFTEDVRSNLFQTFFTTKATGMGVGLSISRSIIEAHGGRMWAESNPSGGATFRFSLPAAPNESLTDVA
jgi:two-component system sensor kinase FixL